MPAAWGFRISNFVQVSASRYRPGGEGHRGREAEHNGCLKHCLVSDWKKTYLYVEERLLSSCDQNQDAGILIFAEGHNCQPIVVATETPVKVAKSQGSRLIRPQLPTCLCKCPWGRR